jgi:hypothetical protein
MAWLDPNDPTSGANNLLTEEQIMNQRKIAAALAARNSGEVMTSPWQVAAKGIEGAVEGWQQARLNDAEKAGRAGASAAGAGLFDTGTPAADVVAPVAVADTPAVAPVFAAGADASDPMTSYLQKVRGIESTGDDTAVSPTGATGRYQFTKGTWSDLAARNPDLGLTPDGRMDPAQQEKAMAVFTRENASKLQEAGIPVTPGSLYLAHQQGAGGAIGLLSNPNAPAGSIVGNQAVAVNGGDPNMPAGAFAQKWMSRFGSTPAPAAPVRVASADPTMVPAGNPAVAAPAPVVAAPQGGPVAAPAAPASPVARVAAVMPPSAAVAPPAPVQTVAQAYGGPTPAQVNAAKQLLTGPYASFATPGQQAVAKAIIEKSMTDPNTYKQTAIAVNRGQFDLDTARTNAPLETRGKQLTNLEAEGRLSNIPLDQEGKRLDNEAKRQNLISKPTYGTIGVDPDTGAEVKGWIDPVTGTTTPVRLPGAPQTGDSPIPKAPPGVDPKTWREQQTRNLASATAPDNIDNMRKEIHQIPSYKTYTAAVTPYLSMLQSVKTDSKAADLDLVYGLAKIMDPNSVVREGEMVMVNNTQGLGDRFAGLLNGVVGGARLTPDARASVMVEAKNRMDAMRQSWDADAGAYGRIADARGINRDHILPKMLDLPEVDVSSISKTDKPTATPAVDTSKPGKFRFNPKTGKMEPF